jgi:transposase
LHASASEQYETEGVHIVSTDEKPGIQALERDGATLPTKEDKVERREFNYIRHGTQVLTANIHLATGKLISPTIADTRTEADFVEHIERLIQSDPDAGLVILCDQLNTHKSESLVRLIAKVLEDDQILGEKGKSGILKSMETRQAYLSDLKHRIRFVYTPKHCSWLNSIEVWFSILTTHVLKRGNFTSRADLQQKIQRYIAYYNEHLAKAWKWSCVLTKDIQALIDKVMRIEGVLDQCELTFRLSSAQEEVTEQNRNVVQDANQAIETRLKIQFKPTLGAVIRFFSPFSGVCALLENGEQAWVESL